MIKQKQKAFTLIELLVVIAIIGLLASIILASLSNARTKARDAKREADVGQLQTALELYYSTNNQYPASGGATSPGGSWSNSNDSSWTTLQTTMASVIPTLPKDPTNQSTSWAGAGSYSYAYYSDPGNGYACGANQWYMIVYVLENKNSPTYNSPGAHPCDGSVFQYGNAANGIVTVGSR